MTDIIIDYAEDRLRASIEANVVALFHTVGIPESMGSLFETEFYAQSVTSVPFPLFNSVVGASLPEDEMDTIIETIMDRCRKKAVPMMWWVGPLSQPAGLEDHLKARGFQLSSSAPGMILDLTEISETQVLPEGLTIQPVTDANMLRTWAITLIRGFGMPENVIEPMHLWMSGTLNNPAKQDGIINYIGYWQEEPVAAATLFMGAGVAGIYNVATLESARQKGVGRAITMRLLRDARSMGYRYSMLHASEMGHSVYEAIGYRTLDSIRTYYWSPDREG